MELNVPFLISSEESGSVEMLKKRYVLLVVLDRGV